MKTLYKKIGEILDTERIGVPVFVRCSAQIKPGHANLMDVLARMLTMVCSWMKANPFQIYAQSENELQQLSVTTHHRGGQTSILSINTAPECNGGLDLMLLGNKGALYYDLDTGAPGIDMIAEPLPVPGWLMNAVKQSLSAKASVTVQEVVN